jgi:hypothetical protein
MVDDPLLMPVPPFADGRIVLPIAAVEARLIDPKPTDEPLRRKIW